jgi:HSP20 family protein
MPDRSNVPRAAAAEGAQVRLAADLRTDGDDYVIEVDVPGVRAEDISVFVVGSAVVVEGRKERPRAPRGARPVYERAERDYGAFRRAFDLPGPADLAKTAAALRAGVLRVTVPRIIDRRGARRRVRVAVDT